MQEKVIAADALEDKADPVQQTNAWDVIRQNPRLHAMQLQFVKNHFQHLGQRFRRITSVMNFTRKLVSNLTGIGKPSHNMVETDRSDDPFRIRLLIHIKTKKRALYSHIVLKRKDLLLKTDRIKSFCPIRLKALEQFLVPHIEIQHLSSLRRFNDS